jgi:hypothetical protein
MMRGRVEQVARRAELDHFADPTVTDNWTKAFGDDTPYDGSIMEQEYVVLAEGLSNLVLSTMEAKHRPPTASWPPRGHRNKGAAL